jgi:hypothetical protein
MIASAIEREMIVLVSDDVQISKIVQFEKSEMWTFDLIYLDMVDISEMNAA